MFDDETKKIWYSIRRQENRGHNRTEGPVSDEMNRREIEEMMQIEKGLEDFLERELEEMNVPRQKAGEAQLFDMREMYEEASEDKSEEFEDITDENWEKEIDVIGVSGGNKRNRSTSSRSNSKKDDYIEDWDNPRRQNAGSGKRSGSRKSTGSRDSGRSRSTGSRKSTGSSRSASTSQKKAQSTQKNRKKKRFGRLKRLLAAVTIILVIGAIGLYYFVGSVYSKMTYREITSMADEPYREDGVINILLIGNDSRENGEDGRSDAMILLSISNKTKQIYMTSLLRDMYVEIPGHDGNRLNAAYSYGGAELLMETIEQNLDIKVNRYVLVNFEAFANLVDAVGGVDLELSTAEIEYVNGYLVEYNMLTNRPQGTDNMDTSVSGMVHLNGPQALAYTRNRFIGTDFGRTERQRKVLSAVIKKLPLAMVANPGELIDGLMPNLTTNLTQWECYRLSFQAGKFLVYDMVQSSIPIEGSYHNASIRGMSVLEVDFDANRQYLQENIYGQTR